MTVEGYYNVLSKEKKRVALHGRVVQMFKELAWKRELDCTQMRERDQLEVCKGEFSSLNGLTIRSL